VKKFAQKNEVIAVVVRRLETVATHGADEANVGSGKPKE
jgi:hypothetical protein